MLLARVSSIQFGGNGTLENWKENFIWKRKLACSPKKLVRGTLIKVGSW